MTIALMLTIPIAELILALLTVKLLKKLSRTPLGITTKKRIARYAFATKVRLMLFKGQLESPCRMYSSRPQHVDMLCLTCAEKGGWLRCRRSKQPVAKLIASSMGHFPQ
jgi:hypothetical protein